MQTVRALRSCTILAGVAAIAACTTSQKTETPPRGDTTIAPATGTAANPPVTSGDTGMRNMGGMNDADVTAAGATGLPAGYTGHPDRADAKLTDAKYVARGNSWEVTTGPAHIVYATKDTASGAYTATTTIQQLEAPRHPEAYGMFVGGRNLDQPSQTYTYFVVRGGGDILVRVRDGAKTRDVIPWRASPAVPKADPAGKATYKLAVRVASDSVRFMVNDREAAAVAKDSVQTDGVAGVRVNHNLHVMVHPVTITRS